MNKLRSKRPSLLTGLLLVILLLALAGGAYAAVTAYSTPKYALYPGGLSTGGSYALQQVAGSRACGVRRPRIGPVKYTGHEYTNGPPL